jgi:hypothetical protein
MKRVHDLRRLNNVFVAIVLLCPISNLSTHVFWRIESSSGELRGVSGCSSRGIDFFAVETGKTHASNGFWQDGADGVLESPRRPGQTYQFS